MGVEKGHLEKLNNWIILAAIDLDLIHAIADVIVDVIVFLGIGLWELS